MRVCRDYKDDICNNHLKFYPTCMEDEKKVAKAFFIKKYPSSLSDRFLTGLATVPAHTIISIYVAPIPKAVTIIIKADTKEELETAEETLVTIGKRNSCQIEAHYLKQRKAGRRENKDFMEAEKAA